MGDEQRELRKLERDISAIYSAIIISANPAEVKTRHEDVFKKTYQAYLALADRLGIPETETREVRDMHSRIFG